MMRSRLPASILFLLAVLSGCASTGGKEVRPVYPSPPEEPRIAYVRSLSGAGDLSGRSFVDALLGAQDRGKMLQPAGVAAWKEKVFVAVSGEHQVYVFDLEKKELGYIGSGGKGKLAFPLGVAVAADGTVFVSDHAQKNVYAFDQQGELKLVLEKKDVFKNPVGLCINDALGRIYVADSYAHVVRAYTLDGKFLFSFGGKGGEDGKLYYPSYIALDRRNGNIVVTDTQNFRVQVFHQDGKFLRKFGQLGDRPGQFSRPKGIGVDSEGHIYVGDTAFGNVQIFDDESRLLMSFGMNGGRMPGLFNGVGGVYVDEKDRVYVTDIFSGRVQIFQYISEAWKKEHPAEYQSLLLAPAAESGATTESGTK